MIDYLIWRMTPRGRAVYRAYAEHARQGPWKAPAAPQPALPARSAGSRERDRAPRARRRKR